jgi:hypothetical protein
MLKRCCYMALTSICALPIFKATAQVGDLSSYGQRHFSRSLTPAFWGKPRTGRSRTFW